jgi:Fe2+ or Zn2+ uptake regulation protein
MGASPSTPTPAEDWAATTAADHGFTDIHLIVELTGLCPACTASTP